MKVYVCNARLYASIVYNVSTRIIKKLYTIVSGKIFKKSEVKSNTIVSKIGKDK